MNAIVRLGLAVCAVAWSSVVAQTAASVPACPDGFAHAEAVRRVEFAAGGKFLVSADRDTVKTWAVPAGSRVSAATVPDKISSFRSSPTEPLVVILTGKYAVELRSVPDLQLVRSWPAGDFGEGLAFSADGKTVATSAHDGIRFWNTINGELVKHIQSKEVFNALAFSPDGKWLASAGRRELIRASPPVLSVWQLSDYTRVREIVTPYRDGTVFAIAFTPDSNLLAAGSNNDHLSLWHIPTGQRALIKDRPGRGLWTVAVATDPQTLFSADRGRVHVWNLPDGSPRVSWEAHSQQVSSIAQSPDGAILVTASDDRTIRFWNLADQTMLRCLTDAQPDPSIAAIRAKTASTAEATLPRKGTAAAKAGAGRIVGGRMIDAGGKPVANLVLKLPLASPAGQGLFYSFAPDYFEVRTDKDGRFKFEGVKSGETYALVHMPGNRPSPLKKADGSVILLKVDSGRAPIDLGEITFERR